MRNCRCEGGGFLRSFASDVRMTWCRVRPLAPQRRASWPGSSGAGSAVVPMSQRSTAAAHERPSAMAQTIRLCPRVWSPQTKTPSTLVAQIASATTVPRALDLDARARPPHCGARCPRSPWRAAPARTRARTRFPAPPRRPGDRPRSRISTSWPRSARTAPEPSSTNSVVVTEKSRSPPSSCAEDVRRISGHSGQGLSASRSLGGSARISSWCTEAAPWRCAVPEAVGSGVAAADDHDPLALRR